MSVDNCHRWSEERKELNQMNNNYTVEVYKGHEIERFNSDFTVFYCGDEVVFSNVKDAKTFIDEISEDE